ncbi:MAG: metallophosphoesterase family protein [Thermoleophilia bacterium]
MTERLALIGDIHGRHDALEAVLRAVRERGITRGVCTGDVVMRGPDPAACIAAVRELGWPTVMGNTDQKVARGAPRPAGHPASDRVGSRSWTIRRLRTGDIAWLQRLPRRVEVDVAGVRVVVSHGQPGDLSVIVDEDTPAEGLLRQAKALGADVLVVGHTHQQMVRRAGRALIVNPGAIGEGTVEDPRPHWAWLEVTADGPVVHTEVVDAPLAPPRGG